MAELADGHSYLRELKNKHDPRYKILVDKVESWHLNNPTFYDQLHAWLHNFTEEDYELALRILINIDYYSEKRFETELRHRLAALKRKGVYLSGTSKNASIVLPDNMVDSAFRHAWLTSKTEGLDGRDALDIGNVSVETANNQALVFINDTHGSGKQFIRDIWTQLEERGIKPSQINIVGIAIAKEAHDIFQQKGFNVIPTDSAANALDIFSGSDLKRIEMFGQTLNGKYPLGYGDNALMVAYHFQCPNNTLPVIWGEGSPTKYPWAPLFPYRSKTKEIETDQKTIDPQRLSTNIKSSEILSPSAIPFPHSSKAGIQFMRGTLIIGNETFNYDKFFLCQKNVNNQEYLEFLEDAFYDSLFSKNQKLGYDWKIRKKALLNKLQSSNGTEDFTGINYEEASNYAEWRGLRLPTLTELRVVALWHFLAHGNTCENISLLTASRPAQDFAFSFSDNLWTSSVYDNHANYCFYGKPNPCDAIRNAGAQGRAIMLDHKVRCVY